ncbi:rhamnogalacturonan acetylesterase [Paenarthrobacter nitroguajacolicus]|uniref:rhamnogalacturonan acetylesterase n=1 Tax=Paenarthrobacter nitroguajacolicus TaxID=211146 RepID=UPI00248C2C9D|nr:rhamnogalacturonan acetylesterase [Paenarthrobacter nitroguajacolicus]MDI2036675.1 Rhamnogalacturonan acetylesterase RhgT [Paenarthrobacter nitroguajacolicus]
MKILLAGDSTVAACPSYEYPMSGWGPHLAPQTYRWGAVHNYAKGGATTESFREEGLWQQLLQQTVQGDVVLLQFGHNDQKREHLAARTGYAENLRRMVVEVRAKGGIPILCTSVERRLFLAGQLEHSLGEFPAVVRELGAELGLDVLDLNRWTRELYLELGEEGSKELFFHFAPGEHAHWAGGLEDNTHFHENGARRIAAYVAGQLEALGYGLGALTTGARA